MKYLHLTLAVVTICGFVLRFVWVLRSSPIARHPLTRILPHVVDALFLLSGILLIVQMRLAVLQNAWLLAKFAGLIAYVMLGMTALRFARSQRARALAFAGAMLAFAYIVGAAILKSPLSWLA